VGKKEREEEKGAAGGYGREREKIRRKASSSHFSEIYNIGRRGGKEKKALRGKRTRKGSLGPFSSPRE